MLSGKQIIAGTVLTVTLTLTGCASRRQATQGYIPQRSQAFSMPSTVTTPYDAGGIVTPGAMTPGSMAPIPDPQLPMAPMGDGGTIAPSLPSLGNLTPIDTMSAKRRKGIFRFIPSLRRKKAAPVVTGGDGQWPADGTVLTEEQFNALPGSGTIQVAPTQQYSTPSAQYSNPSAQYSNPSAQTQPLTPMPDGQLPAARSNHFQTSMAVPTRSVHPAAPPIRRVSSTNVAAAQPVRSQQQYNFGGSWGQRVSGPATIPADTVAAAQPLELPGKSESYEMWPAAQSAQMAQPMMDANSAVGVAVNHEVATQLLPVSNTQPAVLPVIAPAVR